MSEFKPFANDSQVLTLTSGEEEFSVENGTDAIVLSGTLTLTKGDPSSRRNVEELRDLLDRVLKQA